MIEVHQFYSSAHGMSQQYLPAKVTVYVWILFVFCKNVCVVPENDSCQDWTVKWISLSEQHGQPQVSRWAWQSKKS